MMERIQTIFKIPELKRKILFTLMILIVYRIGGHIPIPGVNAQALTQWFESNQGGGLLGLWDMFAGGNFKRATIFALGIMPYISASIILQLLGAVIPYFQKLQKEGEQGRKKITQYTRYGTVALAAAQAWATSIFLVGLGATASGQLIVPNPNFGFRILTIIAVTAGTTLIMWLGEMITERGIGNGISLIIFIGIIARFPNSILEEVQQAMSGNRTLIVEVMLVVVFLVTVAGSIMLTQGTRKIPVQYAKRVVGRKVYGGQSTHIPLRVNTAGVMPIIFAQSIMFLPQTLAQFFPDSNFWAGVNRAFAIDSWIYWLISSLFIIFFTYFYTAIAFNPVDVADNMKKQGGFIPGVRPGKKTSEYIDNILTRITLPGSIALAFIYILPYILATSTNISYNFASFYGGTSLLIVVGVALDTLQQVESHLLMRHYDGFMKSGKIRGRRRF